MSETTEQRKKRIAEQVASYMQNGYNPLTGGNYPDTGREPEGLGEKLDAAFGAPARVGINEMQKGNFSINPFNKESMLRKLLKQVGNDPKSAPTGVDIALDSNVKNPYLGAGIATAADMANLPMPGMSLGKGMGGVAGTVKKVGSDAESLLAKIKTPEQAIALKGAEREAYLKALDEVHGPREQRAKDMGFGDKTWYHGTDHLSDIHKFEQEKLGSHTGEGGTKDRFWFSDNPEVAETFADSASRAKIFRKYHNREDQILRAQADIYNQLKAELEGKDISLDKILKNPHTTRTFVKYGDITPAQAELIKTHSDMSDLVGIQMGDKRREILNTGGQIIPTRIREGKVKTKDMGGKTWQESGAEIPEGKIKLTNFYEDAGPASGTPLGTSLGITNPNQIRSVNAAFDPRFKDSPYLLAGKTGSQSLPINLSPEDENYDYDSEPMMAAVKNKRKPK